MKINNQQLIKNHVYLFGKNSTLIETKSELEICLHQDLVSISNSDIELFEKLKNCKFTRIVKDEKSFTSLYFRKEIKCSVCGEEMNDVPVLENVEYFCEQCGELVWEAQS